METLGKLFGSIAKVKIMRLFLLNQDQGFEAKDVALRARITPATARKELSALAAMDFIKKKTFSKEIVSKKKSAPHQRIKHKRVSGWFFNQNFEYKTSLQDLLIDAEFVTPKNLIQRFKHVGKIKLMLVAGIFTRDPDSRLDLLIVGDNLKRGSIENTIRTLEAEIGKELAYTVFDSAEFFYRANMYDKLVRDVIDYPHREVINLGILSQVPKATF